MPIVLTLVSMALSIAVFAVVMIVMDISMTSMIPFILLILVLSLLPALLKINIRLTHESLFIRMFKGRTIPLRDIASVEVEDYSALKDYGGWGYRVGKKGVGYIAAGAEKGMRINLKDGKSFLVSTKNPLEFESAIKLVLRTNQDKAQL